MVVIVINTFFAIVVVGPGFGAGAGPGFRAGVGVGVGVAAGTVYLRQRRCLCRQSSRCASVGAVRARAGGRARALL